MNRLQSFLKRKFVRDTLILQISKVGVTASSLASSLIIVKLMSLEQYGVWGLIVSLYGIWQFLNFTGIIPSATTLMSEAVGANDQPTLLQVMQIYWRVTVWFCVGGAALFGLASPLLVRWFYADAPHIVYWAGVMTLVYPTQLIFALVGITLTSRRLMRWWAFYQYFDQFTLAILMIVAVWVHPERVCFGDGTPCTWHSDGCGGVDALPTVTPCHRVLLPCVEGDHTGEHER
ncbi:MAG UNVERIFIED_CONTAM: hypothetical protein LVT10_23335 [Anaerolineae bacterium]|jgi:O-antigen/teichoic acid export membrane protein